MKIKIDEDSVISIYETHREETELIIESLSGREFTLSDLVYMEVWLTKAAKVVALKRKELNKKQEKENVKL